MRRGISKRGKVTSGEGRSLGAARSMHPHHTTSANDMVSGADPFGPARDSRYLNRKSWNIGRGDKQTAA